MEPHEMVDPLVVYFKAGDETDDFFDCGEAYWKGGEERTFLIDEFLWAAISELKIKDQFRDLPGWVPLKYGSAYATLYVCGLGRAARILREEAMRLRSDPVDFLMAWSPDPPTHYRVRCSLEDLRGKLHALAEFLDEANVAGVNVGFVLDL